jgi:WD40 repeat protein
MDVKKKVERYILDKGGEKDIWAPTVYHAKPDVKMIFSVPFNANYEKHLGPVLGLSSSPFVKRLFLSCSSDGSVRLYDLLGHRPVMVFEPGYNEYLLDVQWSPFRPAVFATISNLGNVYLYDLSVSKSSPIHILKDPDLDSVTSAQRVAQTIQFNPRQRQFLAIAYHDGNVRIY